MAWNYTKTGLILASANLALCTMLELLREVPFGERGPFVAGIAAIFLLLPIMGFFDLVSAIKAWWQARRSRTAPASQMPEESRLR